METVEHPTTTATGGGSEVVMDRYRLVRRLGGGGFGVVWLAHDLKLDRTVAVKRIPAPDAATAKRAQREGVAAARLQHPAIVALHEAGSDEENVYLVSELVQGATFARLLEEGALSDRDVKPLNILVPDAVGDGGAPAKLTYFGVARIAGDDALTRTGDVVGTLAYMAPEQAEGADVGVEADLYALALCLYEGLSGVNPVRARGAGATARRVGQRLPPLGRLRRDLPLELCEALDAGVWPRPEERGTIAELRAALAAALQRVDDEPGTIAGGPLEPLAPVAGWAGADSRTGLAERAAAALLAAGLAGAALRWAAPAPPVAPLSGALATALAVLALPRLAWLALAAATIVWVGGAGGAPAERAWLLAAAALPVPLLLRRAPSPAWSLPAVAPLLGLATAAGAFPALTGRIARPLHRAALGALGAWWLLLAEALLHRRLVLGAPDGAGGWDAVTAVATSPAIAMAAVWAIAAVLLPLLVRGRLIAVDLVGATAWAAGLAAATQGALGATPRGLVLGAIASALLAIAVRASPTVRESR
ncbi:MAG TPA: serine/threonine-protein kinase [Baekduia sp.]|uniref:serine/threonine-protein kinase n=1 Tax=Baekduia sp. TaxID=2600305 RepID=UPI002C1E37DB|nr:serine/threonine-protein kinase [Baekduia sp.]HMJ37255.1 serine/threonine-protein kinase [Baekduia sp.]